MQNRNLSRQWPPKLFNYGNHIIHSPKIYQFTNLLFEKGGEDHLFYFQPPLIIEQIWNNFSGFDGAEIIACNNYQFAVTK